MDRKHQQMTLVPNWQPALLTGNKVQLQPLQQADFERLFKVASDPLIWEQHPNRNRYQLEDFTTYFEGAMASGGALLILNEETQELIGCSRFYEFDKENKTVKIGYTFFARSCWGKGFNAEVKRLMIAHALQWADTIIFHVGAGNLRSQRAMEKLGANKTGMEDVAYFGEPSKMNVVYEIRKGSWGNHQP